MSTVFGFKAVVDEDFPADLFWSCFDAAVEDLDHDSELYGNCLQLRQRGEVELLDSHAVTELMQFCCGIAGFGDGPEHATDAVLFQAE